MPKKIFSIILFCFIFSFFAMLNIENARAVQFKPQVSIPKAGSGQSFTQNTAVSMGNSTKVLAEYIAAIYKYLIGAIGILATITMMIGGVRWIVSGGNPNAVASAKSWIASSLTGLVLALCSYTILYLVNPDLTKFKIITIKTAEVSPEENEDGVNGCCKKPDGNCITTTQKICMGETKDLPNDQKNSFSSSRTCVNNSCEPKPEGCCLFNKDGDEWESCNIKLQHQCKDPEGGSTWWQQDKKCIDQDYIGTNFICE